MKIKVMDLWMQIEGRKLISIMNFSVLDFFKFASRMPQIAQILVSTFKNFLREHAPRPDSPRYFLFLFSLAIPGSDEWICFLEIRDVYTYWKKEEGASLCVYKKFWK